MKLLTIAITTTYFLKDKVWSEIGLHVVPHVGVRVTLSQSYSDVLCGGLIPNFVLDLLAIQYFGIGLKCKKEG
jgi:hypothetical protein